MLTGFYEQHRSLNGGSNLYRQLDIVKYHDYTLSKHDGYNAILSIETDTVLVYLGDIDERYPRKDQLEHCKQAVRRLELPAIGRGVYEHDELDDLVDSLRGSELIMLPRLGMLAENKKRGIGSRFLKNVLRVATMKSDIMDVSENLTSHDYGKWIEHIYSTHNKLVNSRPLSRHDAKIKRAIRNKYGLENHWTVHVLKTDPERFNRLAQHWRDPHLTAMQAIEQSPDEELGRASRSMWERIFGKRT